MSKRHPSLTGDPELAEPPDPKRQREEGRSRRAPQRTPQSPQSHLPQHVPSSSSSSSSPTSAQQQQQQPTYRDWSTVSSSGPRAPSTGLTPPAPGSLPAESEWSRSLQAPPHAHTSSPPLSSSSSTFIPPSTMPHATTVTMHAAAAEPPAPSSVTAGEVAAAVAASLASSTATSSLSSSFALAAQPSRSPQAAVVAAGGGRSDGGGGGGGDDGGGMGRMDDFSCFREEGRESVLRAFVDSPPYEPPLRETRPDAAAAHQRDSHHAPPLFPAPQAQYCPSSLSQTVPSARRRVFIARPDGLTFVNHVHVGGGGYAPVSHGDTGVREAEARMTAAGDNLFSDRGRSGVFNGGGDDGLGSTRGGGDDAGAHSVGSSASILDLSSVQFGRYGVPDHTDARSGTHSGRGGGGGSGSGGNGAGGGGGGGGDRRGGDQRSTCRSSPSRQTNATNSNIHSNGINPTTSSGNNSNTNRGGAANTSLSTTTAPMTAASVAAAAAAAAAGEEGADDKAYECPLCWELLARPVTIPCGFSLCEACLAQLLSNAWNEGRANAVCPVLGKDCPSGRVWGLPAVSVILHNELTAKFGQRYTQRLAEVDGDSKIRSMVEHARRGSKDGGSTMFRRQRRNQLRGGRGGNHGGFVWWRGLARRVDDGEAARHRGIAPELLERLGFVRFWVSSALARRFLPLLLTLLATYIIPPTPTHTYAQLEHNGMVLWAVQTLFPSWRTWDAVEQCARPHAGPYLRAASLPTDIAAHLGQYRGVFKLTHLKLQVAADFSLIPRVVCTLSLMTHAVSVGVTMLVLMLDRVRRKREDGETWSAIVVGEVFVGGVCLGTANFLSAILHSLQTWSGALRCPVAVRAPVFGAYIWSTAKDVFWVRGALSFILGPRLDLPPAIVDILYEGIEEADSWLGWTSVRYIILLFVISLLSVGILPLPLLLML